MQRRFIVLMATLALAACSSMPTRFYTLAAAPAAASVAPLAAAAMPVFIEIPAVSVPERLARPQIVIRNDETRIDILEQDRWSSPFNNELHDALASAIANRLGAVDVTRGGRPANAPVYRIMLELRQLDAVKGGKVDAQLAWTITRSDSASSGASSVCSLRVMESAADSAVDGVVQAMQRVVARTSDAIAADIVLFRQGQSTCIQ